MRLSLAVLLVFIVDMSVYPAMFADVKMSALFAAIMRAPTSGIVLMVEITPNYSHILPLMLIRLMPTTVAQPGISGSICYNYDRKAPKNSSLKAIY